MTLIDYLQNNPAAFAAVCTVIGGILLKFFEKWLHEHSENRSDRADYRDEIKGLNDRVDKLEVAVSDWRARAFTAEEQVALLRIMIVQMGGELPEKVVERV